MKRILIVAMVCFMAILVNAQGQQSTINIVYDHFSVGINMDNNSWYIPTWKGNGDGTFVGRTQFMCTNSPAPWNELPGVNNSEASVNLETYNPYPGAFSGRDAIFQKIFSPGKGLIFTIRAKLKAPMPGGIVGGIFLYNTNSNPYYHNEIDYELLSNEFNYVHTNIYKDEPLGAGHPDSVNIKNLFPTDITEYHNYIIQWLPDRVLWLIDGDTIFTNTNLVPTEPMYLHINIWAPAKEWQGAYSPGIQPTYWPDSNKIYTLLVDFVKVDSLVDKGVSVIEKQKGKDNFIFYPNPAKNDLNIISSSKTDIGIYSTDGKLLINKNDFTKGKLLINDLNSGIYFIKYELNNIIYTKKLIVIK